ncbi:MAG: dTDP-4-amino-4,6-dideoxygalactose transaminase [Paludibacteraceae bacterium]|nr:dTDP-4-amino-4,6-dideoxygalactose transaminase [Paludibacteraceae bacterium]
MTIPFNKPHLTGKEAHYMYQAVYNGKLSGNGEFTKRCQQFFEERYGFRKCLLTTSGTDALEMCAMLCDLQAGDEVIVPSYTFVSTALAFLREGAKVVFADSMQRNPNLDAETLESLITPRTRVIVPVHYAGVACDMDAIMSVAEKHNLLVVEDAAQAIDSYYISRKSKVESRKPLGGIGHLAAFSFHETKNITAGGEGGLLVVNDERFVRRAEIIWEKGTNRAEFFRGEVNKYGWVDTGSSFLPAEINAAFLWAQLENLDEIQTKRKQLWNRYYELLKPLADKGFFSLPDIPDYASNNAHMFYLVLPNLEKRTALIRHLKENDVLAVFHYLSLHSSAYYVNKHDGRELPNCDRYADTLVRFPMYFDLTLEDVNYVCSIIKEC